MFGLYSSSVSAKRRVAEGEKNNLFMSVWTLISSVSAKPSVVEEAKQSRM